MYETINAKRCVICRKADYGENKGLEKVERCRRCGSPVCVSCQGRCCDKTSEEKE